VAPKKARKAGIAAILLGKLCKPCDCLAIAVSHGRFAAAYVHDVVDGECVIVDLDYLSEARPALAEFGRMKPLALTHHDWDGQLAILVARKTSGLERTIEVVGNRKIRWNDVELGLHEGIWVNWKGPRDAEIDEMLKEVGAFDPGSPARAIDYGEWAQGQQQLLQAEWDAKRRKR
jgi:hypothetical protein